MGNSVPLCGICIGPHQMEDGDNKRHWTDEQNQRVQHVAQTASIRVNFFKFQEFKLQWLIQTGLCIGYISVHLCASHCGSLTFWALLKTSRCRLLLFFLPLKSNRHNQQNALRSSSFSRFLLLFCSFWKRKEKGKCRKTWQKEET